MVVFNYSGKEVSAKIVYYGPGLSGKTTNIEHIYGKVPDTQRGKMVSMKTKTDRTLFFDFLPLSAGEINGFKTRFLLYTVPGQVYYNATRKLVLKGSDGVVFVADSDPELREANLESFANLEKNLSEYGMSAESIPLVLQYNKRDVPNAVGTDVLDSELNRGGWPTVEAVAINGDGVFETFKAITRLVFQKMNERFDRKTARPLAAGAAPVPAPQPQAPVPIVGAASEPVAADAGTAASIDAAEDAERVIHLSSMDKVLSGTQSPLRPQPSAAQQRPGVAPLPTPDPARPRTARPPISQSLSTTLEPSVVPVAPAAPVADATPAAKPDVAAAQEVPWVVHRVRVPVTVPRLKAGRMRVVLDIDLTELPPPSS